MSATLRLFLSAALCCVAVSIADAGAVYWGTRAFSIQVDSRGRDWREGFRMKLGVFSNGFTPSPDNVDEWQVRWIELGTARFDAAENRFAGMVEDSTPLPSGAGRQVYMWALDSDDLTRGPEWLLFTHPDWQWSGTGTLVAAPAKTWVADEAARAIVGGLSDEASYLASASMRPAPVAMADWLSAKLGGSFHPDEDADGDGLNNRLEYFLGTDPGSPSSLASPDLKVEPTGVRISLSRNPYAVSSFVLESSSDLKSWTPEPSETVRNQPDRVEVLSTKLADGRPVFYRFQLQSPATE